VFSANAKTMHRMASMLKRVLIADPQAANARLLGELMRDISGAQVWTAGATEKALQLAEACDPQIIFVELLADGMDGVAFSQRLRRSNLPCRYAPVIMMTGQATAAGILAGRDAGVHEFLRKPFTLKDLTRRLEAVTLHPRDWVEAVAYVGPDRRRFNSAEYSGPLKRRSDSGSGPDTEGVRITQALKILRAAVQAVGDDPAQALRALRVQAAELQKTTDPALAAEGADFARYLADIEAAGEPPDAARLADRAAPLLARLPSTEAVAA
jgi:CheY-like chemotaxis protein